MKLLKFLQISIFVFHGLFVLQYSDVLFHKRVTLVFKREGVLFGKMVKNLPLFLLEGEDFQRRGEDFQRGCEDFLR